ncbi:hypothetical protein ABW21_db0200564 [Orbilia brochopaga]|nr:hypothetical protein ABW21_db0200564 [Drechslerella brochopaga]
MFKPLTTILGLGALLQLAAITSAAVLPRDDPPAQQWFWGVDGDKNNGNFTPEFIAATDDAWSKFDLRFPVTFFGKQYNNMWMSTNGLMSFEEPVSNATATERPLPVNPADCAQNNKGGSCIPGATLAVLWTDLIMESNPNGSGTGIFVGYNTGHPGLTVPHYHIYWMVCDKNAPREPRTGDYADHECGPAYREISLTIRSDQPGIFYLDIALYESDWSHMKGIVGAQSYPQYISVPGDGLFQNNTEGTAVVIDTNHGNYTITHERDE